MLEYNDSLGNWKENTNHIIYIVTYLIAGKNLTFIMCDAEGRVYGFDSLSEAEIHIKLWNSFVREGQLNWSVWARARVVGMSRERLLEHLEKPLSLYSTIHGKAGYAYGLKILEESVDLLRTRAFVSGGVKQSVCG